MPAAHPKEFRRCAVGLGPPVILDLRPRYPVWCSVRPRPGAGVHRRIVRHRSTSYPLSLPPFPMCPDLPDSQYYGGSASLRPDQSTTNPARHLHAGYVFHAGKAGDLPVFTCCSLAEGGTRLSACGTRRWLLRSHSPPAPPGESNSFPERSGCPVTPTASRPRPPHIRRVRGGNTSRQVMTPVSLVYLFGIARRAHAIRRC